MKSGVLWTIGLFAILSSGCVKYVNPVDLNPTGKKYVGTINVRNMELPLPEGEWEVVASCFLNNRNNFNVILEKDEDNRPHTIISIMRETLQNSYTGYLSHKDLKRKDMIYVVSINNKRGEGFDGWFINHLRYRLPNDQSSKAHRSMFQNFIDKKLVLPGNFVYISHLFGGAKPSNKILKYKIYLNPETRGFTPPSNSEWGSSDWNILKINNDPKKLAFIEEVKQEQSVFHEKLHTVFYKK